MGVQESDIEGLKATGVSQHYHTPLQRLYNVVRLDKDST